MNESNVLDLRSALRFLDGHVNLEAAAGRIHGLSLEVMRNLVGVMGEQPSNSVIPLAGLLIGRSRVD